MGEHILMYSENNLTATAIESLPTAYNEDLKKFYRYGCPNKRDTLLQQLRDTVNNARKSFVRLFPNHTKRKDVLNHVLLLLSNSGICVVKSKTLADNVKCSVRTVNDAVKNIKETGEIIVTGLADGSNKYVFVLKTHDNFKQILKEVFFMDIAEPIAEEITEPEITTNIDVMGQNGDNSGVQSFKSFRSSISKHEKSVIQQSVEDEVTSVINTAETIEQAEMYLTAYIDNPIQLQLFHNIHEIPFPEEIQKHSAVLVLRTGLHGTVTPQLASKAIQVLTKIATSMIDRVVIKSVIDVFTYEMFNIGSNPVMKNDTIIVDVVPTVKKVPFYNWLEKRN